LEAGLILHWLLTQDLNGGQRLQMFPPLPQASSEEPGAHWSSLQQPLQLLVLHFPASLHTRCGWMQNWAPTHCLQGWALVPQAALTLPGLQVPPSQQPSGQVVQEQSALHWPETHWVPPAHCWHGAPLAPQMASR
jgi:hypothetical protein